MALTREFAQGLADKYGVAVDFAIHSPDANMDVRNAHAHIMMTTRKVLADGLGDKTDLELENKKLIALGLPTSHDQLRDIRLDWEERANRHLALRAKALGMDMDTRLGRVLQAPSIGEALSAITRGRGQGLGL